MDVSRMTSSHSPSSSVGTSRLEKSTSIHLKVRADTLVRTRTTHTRRRPRNQTNSRRHSFVRSLVSSCGTSLFQCHTDNFDALAELLASYEQIIGTSHFIFVPGPLDPWGSTMLPRPPLPMAFTARFRARIPLAHFACNPCRIKFFGQEIVVMRQDLMDRMLANLVGVKPDLTSTDTKRYVRSVLCCPSDHARSSSSVLDHNGSLYNLLLISATSRRCPSPCSLSIGH